MIKAKKKIQTIISLEMDEDHAEQLNEWLVFAAAVWRECSQHKSLWDEIFHDCKLSGNFPTLKDLNPDRNLTLRLALTNAEVTKE